MLTLQSHLGLRSTGQRYPPPMHICVSLRVFPCLILHITPPSFIIPLFLFLNSPLDLTLHPGPCFRLNTNINAITFIYTQHRKTGPLVPLLIRFLILHNQLWTGNHSAFDVYPTHHTTTITPFKLQPPHTPTRICCSPTHTRLCCTVPVSSSPVLSWPVRHPMRD